MIKITNRKENIYIDNHRKDLRLVWDQFKMLMEQRLEVHDEDKYFKNWSWNKHRQEHPHHFNHQIDYSPNLLDVVEMYLDVVASATRRSKSRPTPDPFDVPQTFNEDTIFKKEVNLLREYNLKNIFKETFKDDKFYPEELLKEIDENNRIS